MKNKKRLLINIDPVGLSSPTRWDVSLRTIDNKPIQGLMLAYFDNENQANYLKKVLNEMFDYLQYD